MVTFLAFQKEFIIDLWMNPILLPTNYFEKHQENGTYVLNFPMKKSHSHCLYHGKLNNSSNSYAAISTCKGLSGVMDDGNEIYYIEPDIASNNESHFLFRAKDMKPRNLACGVSDSDDDATEHYYHFESLKRNRRFTVEKDPNAQNWETRYVEMIVVNDNSEFKKFKGDKDAVYQRTKDIVNAMDAMYSALNIHIVLSGVIIWSEKDEFEVHKNSSHTLNRFIKYRKENLSDEHPNDNAQFITGIKFIGGVLGVAYTGPMCTLKSSGAVSMDSTALASNVAGTVSHELAHNFGVRHDSKDCKCVDRLCLMNEYASSKILHHWSSCSIQKFAQGFARGVDVCLKNYPADMIGPVCGNQFLEKDEECDCGIEPFCKSKCCDAGTCKLKPEAKCYNGDCCDTKRCQVKSAATLCRNATSECDLPEYCDEKNPTCPADVFRQNGELCSNGEARCYDGQCESRTDHCKLLWGEKAADSEHICYSLNLKGYHNSGHCGVDLRTKSFKKCSRQNMLCGILQCTTPDLGLKYFVHGYIKMHSTYFIIKDGDVKCYFLNFDLSHYNRDPSMVPEGAVCGKNKMCVNQTCVDVSSVMDESCSKKCNGHGVCNSNKNCHCDIGYNPPDCLKEGPGGSIDSGPALHLKASPTTMKSIIDIPNGNDSQGSISQNSPTTVALYAVFFGVLPLLLISIGVAYYHRNSIRNWVSKKSGVGSAITLEIDEDIASDSLREK